MYICVIVIGYFEKNTLNYVNSMDSASSGPCFCSDCRVFWLRSLNVNSTMPHPKLTKPFIFRAHSIENRIVLLSEIQRNSVHASAVPQHSLLRWPPVINYTPVNEFDSTNFKASPDPHIPIRTGDERLWHLCECMRIKGSKPGFFP